MLDLRTTLSSLRDLEGIVGSFVVSEGGEVIAKDIPAYFDGVLEEVGPRLLRLREALDMAEGDVSACSVRYAGHKLTIRSIDTALLAVIADAKTNGPALRMAMNLVIRKCGSEDLTVASSRISSVPDHAASARSAFPTVPSSEVTVTPNLAAATRSDGLDGDRHGRPTGGAPEGGHASGRKKREVLFRGKRVS